ncbi:MAG: SMC-Scp complex subunit ScpB [Oscillospiraceae bacterium]|nr:SMC-Scp complex subunit ScpB [Oscillospiraceae bacterium]
MEIEQIKPIIEAILFSSGRVVEVKELMAIFDLSYEDIDSILQNMKASFEMQNRGIEIIKVESGYQLCTKKEYYEYIYPLFDSRNKPTLSNAAMETLSIIAYNPKITRSEIEQIRGVNSDGTIYRLLEYELIEDAGKLDLPGKPTGYRTTEEFLKAFGISSLEELPELPKYRIDENEQIVIDEIVETSEAPTPEREHEGEE